MSKWMLAAGAAALAIMSPAIAERGGQGGGGKGQSAQKSDRGGGGQKARASRGGDRQGQANRGGGSRQVKANRGSEHQARAERGGDRARNQQRFAQTENRGRGGDRDQAKGSRVERRDNVRIESRGRDRAMGEVRIGDDRGRGRDNVRTVKVDRNLNGGKGHGRFAIVDGNDIVSVRDIDRRGVVRVRDIDRDDLFVRQVGFGVGGCPPGLAKKAVACMPPGQAAKLVGQPLVVANRFGALAPLPLSMRGLYWDNDDYYYRWGGGYLYQVDRDDALIASMIPLFGAALVGQPLQPNYLNNYYQPSYFNAFYPSSQYDCYRYGYGYVYETNCMTGFVENVIPTYDYGYGVGQLLPSSYSYYNVPYAYRSQFVDNDDYYYRYAPGAIYQVDRGSALITAVAALLTGGLTVGQPLPMGYSAYNVPLSYRTTYYDTPDVWYRYNNGYIYAVDPGTRMVNSIAYAIV